MVASKFLVWVLAGAAVASAASSSSGPGRRVARKVVPGGFIVEFHDGADPTPFRSAVRTKARTRYTFSHPLFRGASIQFSDAATAEAEAGTLASLPSVKRIWPLTVYPPPDDQVHWTGRRSAGAGATGNVKRQYGSGNDSFSPHVMTQVDKLRADGHVGKGVKVAIIDTGIDYRHPALGGGFGDGFLVSYGYDVVGDDYDGFNVPRPDDDPFDCGGHGTHVAGIVAAQQNEYGFTGAAPGVTLGAYRVFGCEGSAANDVLIEAYIRAFDAGSNIITASIGGASGWSEEPWAVVVSRIVAAGVPCTVSAGNSGDMGLFYASTAANGKQVTAIASFDNTQSPTLLTTSYVSVDDSANATFGYALGTPSDWAGVNLPLWTASFDITDPAGGCEPYAADTPDLSGFVVLIRRGSCTFVTKAQNAVDHGARYILFYNNVGGATGPSIDGVDGLLASGMVTRDVGEGWVAALEAGSTVTVHMLDPDTAPVILSSTPNTVTGGLLSTYTSWGPTFEADLKPQLGAPGGQILSTYPTALGSYAVLSGTSMSAPIVAGIYALVGEVRKTFDPQTLESVLSATANAQLLNDGSATASSLAPVPQQGAGLVQAYDAAHLKTILSRSGLAFNDTDNLVKTLTFTISNTDTARDVTYHLGHVAATTAYTLSGSPYPDTFPGLDFDGSDQAAARLEIQPSRVTVAAGDSAEISVTVTPPALDRTRLPVYSGYITINGSSSRGSDSSLALPYQGVVGSLHSTQVLDTAYLSISTDGPDYRPVVGSNSSFLLSRTNSSQVLPVMVVQLAFGSPLVKIEAVVVRPDGRASSLGNILAFPYPWAPRDSLLVEWNGQLEDESFAPAGTYFLSAEALHIFGNESDPTDYDVAQTVKFHIRY